MARFSKCTSLMEQTTSHAQNWYCDTVHHHEHNSVCYCIFPLFTYLTFHVFHRQTRRAESISFYFWTQVNGNGLHIRKTRPCNVYPLIPPIHIIRLGFTGIYLFFLFLIQNIDCGYSLETPQRGGSNVYLQLMF